MARDVFISYQSSDKECADRVCEALEQQSISCWIAPRDIPIGAEWAAAIVEGLQRCHSFVVILSSNSTSTRQIAREAELADNHKLPIFTLRIEDVEPPPGLLYFLGNVQWVDAFDGQFEEALGRLTEVVRRTANYPAEKTKVYRTAAAGVGGASASEPDFTAAPPTPESPIKLLRRSATLKIVAGLALCVLIALAGWLLARRSHRPVHERSRMGARPATFDGRKQTAASEARAVAERFLNYRESADYPAAWREFTAVHQAGSPEPRWTQRAQDWTKNHGQTIRHTIESCTPDDSGDIYNCLVSVGYEHNLSAQDRLVVAQERGGRWAIASSARTPPK
ncbi:MAG TPA: toll/interleukin-1 receptor domain-containing protein [Bryobacteraceae bacterium]|nr:toll/interleukin-1 receptor domain-containing protein [Bryobacteraceae bacterium]